LSIFVIATGTSFGHGLAGIRRSSERRSQMMWGLGYGGWGSWMGWVGPALMVSVWALIITGGIFLIRFLVRHGGGRRQEDSALEILKRRYAQGEVSREEYEKIRNGLT
jgi:putative membrane protein